MSTSDAQLRDLVAVYLDGSATDEQYRHLAAMLAQSPKAVEVLRAQAAMHQLLEDAAAEPQAAALTTVAVLERLRAESQGPEFLKRLLPRLRSSQPGAQPSARASGGLRSTRRPRTRPSSRALQITMGALAACLAVVVGLFFAQSQGSRSVATIEDAVGVAVISDGQQSVATSGMQIESGQRLEVAANGRLLLAYRDATAIAARGATALQVWQDDAKRIELHGGRIECDVRPQPADRPLRISTPQAEITVVGTRLILAVDAATTRLEVVEGLVRFRSDERSGELAAGRHVVLGGAGPSAPIALYRFDEGAGSVVRDQSGIDDPLDLHVRGTGVAWIAGEAGLRFSGDESSDGRLISDGPAKKLFKRITATGQFSVEVWIDPERLRQRGPARLVSYSRGPAARNFSLLYGSRPEADPNDDIVARVRTSETNHNAAPEITASKAAESGRGHYVLSYDGSDVRIYRNGELVATEHRGAIADWSEAYPLVVGNEAEMEDWGGLTWRPFLGDIVRVAIYETALDDTAVRRLYDDKP